MKRKHLGRLAGGALIAGICVCAVESGLAATNYIIDTYPLDTGADAVTNWNMLWGNAPYTVTFDPTTDANGNPNSGAVRFDVDFTAGGDLAMGRGLPTGPWTWGGNAVPNTNSTYGSLEFDILWSTNSTPDNNGTWAKFNNMPVPGAGDWEWNNAAFYVPTNPPGVWHHVKHSFPVTFNPPYLYGWAFYLYENNNPANGGENTIRGPVTFWLDNVMFVTNVIPPPPAPTLAISKFSPPAGLQLTAAAFNNPASRQNVRVLSPLPIFQNPDPAVYSVTVTNFPSTNYSEFEMHLFFVGGSPGGEVAPDHNQPDVMILRVLNNTNGTVTASFNYKTNAPGSSGPAAYGPGLVADLTVPSALGTWTVTFTGAQGISLAAPNGASTNFSLLPDTAAVFGSQAYFYLGVTPSNTNNIGQSATVSRVLMYSGSSTNVDDRFATAPLDSNYWQVLADIPPAVFVAPAESSLWISWTLPDTDFGLQATTNLTDSTSWADPLPLTVFQNNTRRQVLLTNELISASFFRLAKTNSP